MAKKRFSANYFKIVDTTAQAKTSAYLLSVISGERNEELLVSIQEKQAQVNEIRSKF